MVLVSAQLPCLAWMRLTGEFQKPSGTYPYGFRHPERSLAILEVVSRSVSVLMGVGLVALACGIASILFGPLAGLAAAVLVAGCYPIVFYAHMTNVDVPVLFWSALGVWAALVAAERDSTAAAVLAGLGAGMALFTKEQSIGIVAGVPVVWAIQRSTRPGARWRGTMRHMLAAGGGFLVVAAIAGNCLWNPSGLIDRWRYLAGVLPAEIRAKYFPYQSMIQVPTAMARSAEVQHVLKVFSTAAAGVTLPIFVVCVAGLLWALWWRARQALIPLVLLVGYYVLSSRALVLVPVRYTMPVMYVFLILGGAAGGAAIEWVGRLRHAGARRAAMCMSLIAAGVALLPGIEVDHLLVRDPRYVAEAWLREHAGANEHIETYQRLTYLPRFVPDAVVVQVPIEQRRACRPDRSLPAGLATGTLDCGGVGLGAGVRRCAAE
jgi:4-amino-4-deoxy-L-arabinose transferase-like glycosyltransferase